MPWVRARLRGEQVFARADAQGRLAIQGGFVEVRYRRRGGRAYRARDANVVVEAPIELLPDDAVGEVSEAPSAAPPPGSGTTRVERQATSVRPGDAPAGAKRGPPRLAAERGAVTVFTDGACSGNPGPAGIGIVIVDGARRVEVSEFLGPATSNIAELTGILRALELVAPDRPLVLHTDSSYSIGVLQEGWRAKANLDLIASIRQGMRSRRVKLVKVKGHAGVALNERADRLARLAIETRSSRRDEQVDVEAPDRT